MARTQAADYDKRREAIMDAAAKLYATRGFHATSIADIGEACNTSKSLLYHYFPSKEDLLFEVMTSHLLGLVEAGHAVEEKGGTPEHRIQSLAEQLMKLYGGARHHQKVLIDELNSLPPRRRAEVVRVQRRLIDIFDRFLVELRPDLSRHKGQRRVATMLFFGMLNWTANWLDPAGEMTGKQVAALASRMLISGLAR